MFELKLLDWMFCFNFPEFLKNFNFMASELSFSDKDVEEEAGVIKLLTFGGVTSIFVGAR